MQLQAIFNLIKEWRQYISSRRVPKEDNIWVFGAIRGQRYIDNAKYFFEYINKNTDIRAVWITKNVKVIDQIQNKGYEVYHEDSNEAHFYAERARVAVITHRGNRHQSDLPFHWLSKETFIVQLWHGIPLKKIAFDDQYFSFTHNENSILWKLKGILKNTLFPFRLFVNKPGLIPASSEETKAIYSSAFRVPLENVAITGYPRNDKLIEAASNDTDGPIRNIIYMPTFRGDENSDFDLFSQYDFSTEDFDNFLTENGLQLHIKLHPFNYPSASLLNSIEEASNISLLDCEDIYEVLQDYQLLITDYSSIYFDYLMLNRPIIFAPFDKNSYLGKQRGFYFDYDEVTPGPKAMTWPEVLQLIAKFSDDPTWYSKEREEISARFHAIQDKNNCSRLYNEILTRLQ